MTDAWKALVEAGLPDGAARPPPGALDAARTRAAVRELATRFDTLDVTDRELLLAWLRAFAHHWPVAFADTLGEDGQALAERLLIAPHDPERYLKLRRIAIENLSGAL